MCVGRPISIAEPTPNNVVYVNFYLSFLYTGTIENPPKWVY